MPTISLCMIVKNEEGKIDKCLSSVKNAIDEIIIVDTGSTDKTKDIVKKYTDKIFDFEWIDDFAAARNESFRHATGDYILWLDADDVLLPEDAMKLTQLKNSLSSDITNVTFNYNYAFDEEGNPSLVFRRERLVKRNMAFQWVGFIHEYIEVTGNTLDADIYVTHTRVHGDSERNLNIYRRKLKEGVEFTPRDKYYYGKELYYHNMLDDAIRVLEEFVLMPCWIEDYLDALYRISECYQLKKDAEKARETIFRCFINEKPRGEGLCRLAKSFQDEKKYDTAIYWYEQIFTMNIPSNTNGFLFIEDWTWKPHLELCVCYYAIGNIEKAIYHNEKAAEFVPNHGAVKFNRNFFSTI